MFVATIQPLKFQSTLPRGERRHEVQQQTQVRDFNPRSHEGSDCGKGLQRSTTLLFQSTLPRGERRSRSVYSLCHYAISIHAPTRGATIAFSVFSVPLRNFNPRSHEGSDNADLNMRSSKQKFQSTLPRGERHRPQINQRA